MIFVDNKEFIHKVTNNKYTHRVFYRNVAFYVMFPKNETMWHVYLIYVIFKGTIPMREKKAILIFILNFNSI